MTDLVVTGDGRLTAAGSRYRCAVGRGGITADKREGDGATPAGRFPLREILYRADRLNRPATGLPAQPIRPEDGWCDDPADAAYNRPVALPYAASTEALWREDRLYDVIVVIGYNDDAPVPGRGSAIFLHVAAPDYAPTDGCVALSLTDLLRILADLDSGSTIMIQEA